MFKAGGASVVVCGLLAAATLLASDAPRLIVFGFWAGLWVLFTLWVGLPWRKLMRGQIPILQDGLRTGRVRVIQETDVTGLTATPDRSTVTGVMVRPRGPGDGEGAAEEVMAADLVVDASGRTSHAPRWL